MANPVDSHALLGGANLPLALMPVRVETRFSKDAQGNYVEVQHGQPYAPAIDAAGNADCQTGQNGYPSGPLPAAGTMPSMPTRTR